MLGTAEVVILAGGELRPAGRGNKKKKENKQVCLNWIAKHFVYWDKNDANRLKLSHLQRVNTNSTGTHVHARYVCALMQEHGYDVSLSQLFFCFVLFLCDASRRIAEEATCEKWACPQCLCGTLLAPTAKDDETAMQLLREQKEEKKYGLNRRRLQREIRLSEQVVKTQSCLLLLYIIKKTK